MPYEGSRLIHIDVTAIADFLEVLYANRIKHFANSITITCKGKSFF